MSVLRPTDREVSQEIFRLMRVDPWNSFTVYHLAKRLGRSAARIRRILQAEPIFKVNYHARNRYGAEEWQISDTYYARQSGG